MPSPENRILKLEASAGSGKTYRLTREYLSRLFEAFAALKEPAGDLRLAGGLLGSILAVTFTIKAAQEMKGRILKSLKAFALAEGGSGLDKTDASLLRDLASATGLPPDRILELSRVLIEIILAGYDDFNVTTIDSLMAAMVKVLSPELGLPADYEIEVDAGEEMTERARSMLAALADDDWTRLERLLAEFRGLNPRVAWNIDEAIAGKAIGLFSKTLQQENPGALEDAARLRRRMASSWAAFLRRLHPLRDVLAAEPAKNGKCDYLNGSYVRPAFLEAVEEAVRNGGDYLVLNRFIGGSFFSKRDPQAMLVKAAPAGYRDRFLRAYGPARESFGRAVYDYSGLKTAVYREFLRRFEAAWGDGKKTLYVAEFSRTLESLFKEWDEKAFPYLYLKMSDVFRHFLFDEFQDTSTLQFAALAPLIDERFSRDPGASLFLVGDRKQAIYRWRGGNSELMDEDVLRRHVPQISAVDDGRGFTSTLGENRRSLREIVEFNNAFWDPEGISEIAPPGDLRAAVRENFKNSGQAMPKDRAGEEKGGYVEVSFRLEAEDDPDEESGRDAAGTDDPGEDEGGDLTAAHLDDIRTVIDRLHDRHGYAYSDIAVLVRKNAQVRDVVRRLGRHDIPTFSDRSLMLDSNVRIGEIIAFLRFLDYPPDNLNFFAFIRGALFRKEAEARFPEEMKAFAESVFIGAPGAYYKLFQERFPAAWKGLIEPFFQSVGFLPPYDLFCDFTRVFRIFESFPDDTPFFLTLGDTLHQAELEGGHSIASFNLLWKKMTEKEDTPSVAIPGNAPGVRVLTMHQSKGLEFPAVIVPLNDKAGRGDGPLHWVARGLFSIDKAAALSSPDLRAIYEKENIRATVDALNLLYVAFTRAREALFVPVAAARPPKRPGEADGDLVKKIDRTSDIVARHPLLGWSGDASPKRYSRGVLALKKAGAVSVPRPGPVPSKKVMTRSWQSRYLVFRRNGRGERREGADRGERIHELLCRLGGAAGTAETAARARALAEGLGLEENDIRTVVSFLGREDVIGLLRRGRVFHAEKDIVARFGGRPEFLRLDRLQIGPDEVIVIDYKTGGEISSAHRNQIRMYLDAIGPLFPGRRRRAFLLYLDRDEVEEVACSS